MNEKILKMFCLKLLNTYKISYNSQYFLKSGLQWRIESSVRCPDCPTLAWINNKSALNSFRYTFPEKMYQLMSRVCINNKTYLQNYFIYFNYKAAGRCSPKSHNDYEIQTITIICVAFCHIVKVHHKSDWKPFFRTWSDMWSIKIDHQDTETSMQIYFP